MKTKVPISLLMTLCVVIMGSSGLAKEQTFDFKDPKGVHSIGIFLDSKLEPMRGSANGISGSAVFDLEKLGITKGVIEVAANSIQMTNPTMTTHLHGEEWINVEKFPNVKATFNKLVSAKKVSDNKFEMVVMGSFTLKGITKKMTVPISVTFHKGQEKTRNHKGEGDLIVVRAKFSIDRVDYNIKPDMPGIIVAKKIQLDLALVGYSK